MTSSGLALLAVMTMLIAAAAAVFWPLRRSHAARPRDRDDPLEFARDSKLAEINDLELDFRLGKLSPEDYQALNATLRSEAVEIIRRIDSTAQSANGSSPRSQRR